MKPVHGARGPVACNTYQHPKMRPATLACLAACLAACQPKMTQPDITANLCPVAQSCWHTGQYSKRYLCWYFSLQQNMSASKLLSTWTIGSHPKHCACQLHLKSWRTACILCHGNECWSHTAHQEVGAVIWVLHTTNLWLTTQFTGLKHGIRSPDPFLGGGRAICLAVAGFWRHLSPIIKLNLDCNTDDIL